MRKSFAFLALICLISFGCRNSKHSIPDHITLTWAGDPHTTQTITWRTDTTEKQGDVRFTEDSLNFESNATIFAQTDSGKFITDIGTWYLHTVAIKNLVAGRKYYYKVGYGDNYSAISSFRTEDTISKTFSFLIFA